MRTPSPPLPTKRPRGLWTGRREALDAKAATRSHDACSDSTSTSTGTDLFDDDFDDDHSSDSSFKRRRLSGALSDSDTLCHQSPSSRALTPDLCYHGSCFPSQILSFPPALTMNPDKPASINCPSTRKRPSRSDLEDWENLKELFARASESYDCDEIEDTLPLLRAVIRECHRFLLAHPDPSAVYTSPGSGHASRSPDTLTPTEERLRRDWPPESLDTRLRSSRSFRPHASAQKSLDPPTAFHAMFGTALYLMGSIISQEPAQALPDEPSSASTYWLGALDVFETGESLSSMLASSASIQDDWRMYVSWGRTLVSLAEEKIAHSLRTSPSSSSSPPAMPSLKDLRNGWLPYQQPTVGPFSRVEPRWSPESPFHAIAAARPPVTRRMSLYSASAHDVMILAMDQLSRGIFHMPHPQYSATHNPSALQLNHLSAPLSMDGPGFLSASHAWRHRSFSPPASSTGSSTLEFSRPRELFTIATEVLSVAERLANAAHREHWAMQADSVFNQMKMEADMGEWRMAVNAARGRCWLIVGEARAEDMEHALERGDVSVLESAEADEARDGLAMAVTFLERAKGSATARPHPDREDLPPVLAEALLTLANLTVDENAREELYARAQTEGGDALALELDPPSTAFPAAISSIGTTAAKLAACTTPVEASPSLLFATVRAKHEPS